MRLQRVRDILGARVLCGEQLLDMHVDGACGADLMSDVLAGVKRNTLLLTGLCTTQALRTAEMIEINAIVFVRGKQPPDDVLRLAEELSMVVMATPLTMFHACGKLFEKGLRPCIKEEADAQ
jgi:predicted transcriptional regulator